MPSPHAPHDPPRVSVVIVNYNGRSLLEDCLSALSRTRGPAFETLVVDNGSSDDSVAWLRRAHPDVRVLEAGANLGFGEGNRRGVAAARGEIVALLNSDTMVEPGWLAPLVEALDGDAGLGAVCSKLVLAQAPEVLNALGGAMSWVGIGYDRGFGMPLELGAGPPLEDVLFPTAAAMAMRKRDFDALGGFDRAFFMYHEDVDLGWRVWLSGRRVALVRASVVVHGFGGTSKRTFGPSFSQRLGLRHLVRSLIKNYEPARALRALYKLHALWIRQRKLRPFLSVWSWNLPRLWDTLRARRAIQRGRRISDAELFERGLIARDNPWPPSRGELPAVSAEWGSRRWLETPRLLLGEDSSIGRLGPGWFAPEARLRASVVDAEPTERVRPFSGHASAWLRSRPDADGRLTLCWRALWKEGAALEIECNGVATRVDWPAPGPRWIETRVPVASDGAGLVQVTLRVAGVPIDRAAGEALELRFDPLHAPSPEEGPARTISVVIPTYNRLDRLEETLAALDRQTHPPLEVVVVDDGSTDGTWARLTELARSGGFRVPLHVRTQTNSGPGGARNLGVQVARGDWILFLGDDTIPGPDCVERHVQAQRRHGENCAVVGYTEWCRRRMRVTPFLDVVNNEGYQFGYAHLRDGSDTPFTCFYTSNVSVPRRLMLEEPFHPAFRHAAWEDVELGWRLNLRGLRIVYCSDATTEHVHPMGVADFLRRQRSVGERAWTIFDCHPSLRDNPAILPSTFPVETYARLEPWLRWTVPLVEALDRARIPLPRVVYHTLLMSSFCRGLQHARRAT